jgi:DNA-binding IclR family transcriptional regulator
MAKLTLAAKTAEPSTDVHRTPAVARAATVLRLLVGQRTPLGVTEIARRVGLVPSTCLHVLRALVYEGLVTFDSQAKTYRIGVGLFTLVRDVMASTEFPQAVQPILDRFAIDYEVTALALELDHHDRLVVVGISRTSNYVTLHIKIGTSFPSLINATGSQASSLSNLGREELREQFEALGWERPPTFEDWTAEVERARTEGIAVDRGNYFRDLSIASTLLPIGMDRVPRAIALIGFEHYMTERMIRQLKDELLRAAQAVAARLH